MPLNSLGAIIQDRPSARFGFRLDVTRGCRAQACFLCERIQAGETLIVETMPLRQRAEAEQKAAEWLETKKKKSVSSADDDTNETKLLARTILAILRT